MRAQSDAIPSLTSIIAWTPAARQGPPGLDQRPRAQVAVEQRGSRLSVEPAELSLEQEQARRPTPPSAPVTPTRSPGRAPSRPTSSRLVVGVPDAVTDTNSSWLRGQVAAADRDAELGGERLARPRRSSSHLALAQVLGQAQHEVGLARARRPSRRCRRVAAGEALVAEVAHRGGREPEVHALHERVHGGDRDARRSAPRPRRRPSRAGRGRRASANRLADRVDQLELGQVNSGEKAHSGTAITSMYAHSTMRCRPAERRSRLSAASGSSQIAYQGTSQAVATQQRERRPAGGRDPCPRVGAALARRSAAGAARPRRQQQPERAARVVARSSRRSPPVSAPTPSAARCGTLQRLVRSWFSPIRTNASQRAVRRTRPARHAATTTMRRRAPASRQRRRSRRRST